MAKKKRKHKIKRSSKVGLPPGSLVFVGQEKTEKVKITVIDYNLEAYEEVVIDDRSKIEAYLQKNTVTWINIDGVHDVELIEQVGKLFNLHPLLLEDILNTEHRPKVEEFDDAIFFTLKMLSYNNGDIDAEQVSFVLGQSFVLSFQEREGDIFEPVRERLRNGKGRIRARKSDYLSFALVDVVVDNYFYIIEKLGEETEELEEEVIEDPEEKVLHRIQKMKRDLIMLRRSIYPLREAVNKLEKGENGLIEQSTLRFFRDVYDHIVHVIDMLESYRDINSGLKDMYLSSISNRMNQVMKVLTIIATIFIPLTFIAGVYGMNFEYMPELHWKYGYPLVWVIMIVVGISMVIYFWKKKWL